MHVFACLPTLWPVRRCGFAQGGRPYSTMAMQQSLRKRTCICRRISHTRRIPVGAQALAGWLLQVPAPPAEAFFVWPRRCLQWGELPTPAATPNHSGVYHSASCSGTSCGGSLRAPENAAFSSLKRECLAGTRRSCGCCRRRSTRFRLFVQANGYGSFRAVHKHPRRINSATPGISIARTSCPSGV